MELFEKRFVHFLWEDELEGKEGFFADDICTLMTCVLGGNIHYAKVRKSLNPAFPFKDTNNNDWLFFYYDPNYDCKRAYAEGRQIQFKRLVNGTWCDCGNMECLWKDFYKYRIKPEEPKSRRMTYRELAEWLAKGNGQSKTGLVAGIQVGYDSIVSKDKKRTF